MNIITAYQYNNCLIAYEETDLLLQGMLGVVVVFNTVQRFEVGKIF